MNSQRMEPYATLAMLPMKDTMEVAPKLVIDELYGEKFSEVIAEAERISFDPTFFGDYPLMHRLLRKWPNVSHNNNNLTVEYRDLQHHHSLPQHHLSFLKRRFEKHAHLLNMHQNEYFETTLKLFERVDEEIQDAFMSSTYGYFGYRLFLVNDFMTRLENCRLYPTIDTIRVHISPGDQPMGNYQILSRISLYMDDSFRFIRPPVYDPWDVQGEYDPKDQVFLL